MMPNEDFCYYLFIRKVFPWHFLQWKKRNDVKFTKVSAQLPKPI